MTENNDHDYIKQFLPPARQEAELLGSESRWACPLTARNVRDEKRHASGTLFFIARGIALTAWHNFPHLIAMVTGNEVVGHADFAWPSHQEIADVEFLTFQMVSDEHCIQWSVREVVRCSFSNDIAILYLSPTHEVPSETPLWLAPLDADPPAFKERVRAFGYTESEMDPEMDQEGYVALGFVPLNAAGDVTQLYEPQRDPMLLPFPCFEVHADFRPGMSGGPVINSQGRVCGVVTRGVTNLEGEFSISYGASIFPIIGEKILWKDFNGGQPFLLGELIASPESPHRHPMIRCHNAEKYVVVIDQKTHQPVSIHRRS